MNNKGQSANRRTIDETLQAITTRKTPVPKSGFILLILLYVLATVVLIRVTRMGGEITIAGNVIQLRDLAGVFSSLANLCVILLVVIYRTPGFITGLAILITQFPVVFIDIIRKHNFDAISGFFTNFLTIIVIILIYIKPLSENRFGTGGDGPSDRSAEPFCRKRIFRRTHQSKREVCIRGGGYQQFQEHQ